jgi:hypothetical protein
MKNLGRNLVMMIVVTVRIRTKHLPNKGKKLTA